VLWKINAKYLELKVAIDEPYGGIGTQGGLEDGLDLLGVRWIPVSKSREGYTGMLFRATFSPCFLGFPPHFLSQTLQIFTPP
jgi:hypothetical protein